MTANIISEFTHIHKVYSRAKMTDEQANRLDAMFRAFLAFIQGQEPLLRSL